MGLDAARPVSLTAECAMGWRHRSPLAVDTCSAMAIAHGPAMHAQVMRGWEAQSSARSIAVAYTPPVLGSSDEEGGNDDSSSEPEWDGAPLALPASLPPCPPLPCAVGCADASGSLGLTRVMCYDGGAADDDTDDEGTCRAHPDPTSSSTALGLLLWLHAGHPHGVWCGRGGLARVNNRRASAAGGGGVTTTDLHALISTDQRQHQHLPVRRPLPAWCALGSGVPCVACGTIRF